MQIPKLISYCGPAIFGLLVLMGILSVEVPAQLRVVVLAIPIPLGTVLGLIYYFRVGHQVLQYDERGFRLATGRNDVQSYEWQQFKEVSLSADAKGGINVRLYFDPEGKYVEIPASKTGANPFVIRNGLLVILKSR